MNKTKLDSLINLGVSRRKFLAGAGSGVGAAAFALAGCGGGGSTLNTVTTTVAPATTAATTITDADILNFALNLEYLEAEFYLRATTGAGLPSSAIGSSAGTVTGGAMVPFVTPLIKELALEIANDEMEHVLFLRSALGSAAVSRPTIDFTDAFAAAGTAAGVKGITFNPFADENQFVLGGFTFEDVGVTAYNGAVTLISSKAYLTAAAEIHATEAYHAAALRTLLANQLDPGYLIIANLISALRGAASASVSNGTADETTVSTSTIVAADSNSLVYHRTTDEVLHIVYLDATSGSVGSGGFYPNGMNGTIATSAS